MKIEQFFKVTIGDSTLELTSAKLRTLATMNVKPTYTFLIDEKTFTLSEQEYKSLKAVASSTLSITPRAKKSPTKYLPETIRSVFDGVIVDWRTIQNIIDACEHKYTTVCSVLRQLHKDGKIDKRRDPDRMNAIQYKLKTGIVRRPERDEIPKIDVVEEEGRFDETALQKDKQQRQLAQRER